MNQPHNWVLVYWTKKITLEKRLLKIPISEIGNPFLWISKCHKKPHYARNACILSVIIFVTFTLVTFTSPMPTANQVGRIRISAFICGPDYVFVIYFEFSQIFSHERNWHKKSSTVFQNFNPWMINIFSVTYKRSDLAKLVFWSIISFENWSFAK